MDFPGGPVVDSKLTMQVARVQSLVGQLKYCMPHSVAPQKTHMDCIGLNKIFS